MEDHTLENHIKTVATSYKKVKSIMHTPIAPKKTTKSNASPPSLLNNDSFSDSTIYNSTVFMTPEQTFNNGPSHEETLQSLADLSVANETLKTQLSMYHQHNDQLTEQKMKLSQQLGIQTQVGLGNEFITIILNKTTRLLCRCFARKALIDSSSTELKRLSWVNNNN